MRQSCSWTADFVKHLIVTRCTYGFLVKKLMLGVSRRSSCDSDGGATRGATNSESATRVDSPLPIRLGVRYGASAQSGRSPCKNGVKGSAASLYEFLILHSPRQVGSCRPRSEERVNAKKDPVPPLTVGGGNGYAPH